MRRHRGRTGKWLGLHVRNPRRDRLRGRDTCGRTRLHGDVRGGTHTLREIGPLPPSGARGDLDLSKTEFEQIDPRRVRVTGTVFSPDDTHSIKLEGARLTGFRTVSIAGVRAPDFIAAMDDIIAGKNRRRRAVSRDRHGSASLIFRVYGRDGVMGELEANGIIPTRGRACHRSGSGKPGERRRDMLLRPVEPASLRLRGPEIDRRQPCLSLFAI